MKLKDSASLFLSKKKEALDFVKKNLTVKGIMNGPNGQPAMYEYRVAKKNDPEVYAAIAKEFPGRISAVCIRDVSAAGETAKRIAALKDGNVRWILFNDGNDLKKSLGK